MKKKQERQHRDRWRHGAASGISRITADNGKYQKESNQMDEQKQALIDKCIALMKKLYMKRLEPFLANRETITNQEIWDFVVKTVDSVPTLKRKDAIAEDFAKWLYNCTIEGLQKGD